MITNRDDEFRGTITYFFIQELGHPPNADQMAAYLAWAQAGATGEQIQQNLHNEPEAVAYRSKPVPPPVPRLEIRGRYFVDATGQRLVLNGTDMFLAYRQFLDGVDLTPFLNESKELGFNMWRVFFQGSRAQNQVLQLSPTEPGYYDKVRAFADLLNANGIILLATIGVDNQDIQSPVAHWARMADLLRGTGTILSFGNEWSKNGFNPGDIPAPAGILWSRGSDVGDALPFRPNGPVIEFHPVRNYTTAMRDAVASPIEIFEVQGFQGALLIDEPGRMGTNAHDSRFTDPKEVYAYARILSTLSAGVVMHNFFGQRGLLMDGLTRECAKAWTAGTRVQ